MLEGGGNMTGLRMLCATSTLLLAGCQSASFAPPSVSLPVSMTAAAAAAPGSCSAVSDTSIGLNVDGALKLAGNYLRAYRCARDQAANGRQVFQLPAFLALAGSAAAVAFGGGQNWGIAGTIGNQFFTAGNDYYAPAQQAQILRESVDALNCIHVEATHMPALARLQRVSDGGGADAARAMFGASGGTVSVTAERQYFNLVA